MPKRTDLKSILIIGAGPIVIGQACEFDYSGAQACKALREEGFRVILVNSNPATIMTDPEMADAIYIEPIEWRTVAQIIANEQPDALLPTMGGQTALNCALDLAREGVLDRHGVEMIGATRDAIDMAEDRERFRDAMIEIGLDVPDAAIAHSLEEALQHQASIGSVAECFVGKGWVACAQNRVFTEIDIEFCFKRIVHINPGQNAKPLILQCIDYTCHRLIIGRVHLNFISHAGHCLLLKLDIVNIPL